MAVFCVTVSVKDSDAGKILSTAAYPSPDSYVTKGVVMGGVSEGRKCSIMR